MKTIKVNEVDWNWLMNQKNKMNLKSIDVLIHNIIKLIKFDKLQKDLENMK